MNETTKIKKPSAAQIAGSRSCASVLYLTLKKKWFDMILSGEKKEEYREIKKYWFKRLVYQPELVFKYCTGYDLEEGLFLSEGLDHITRNKALMVGFRPFDVICFRHGYAKDAREIWVKCDGIQIGLGMSIWGAELDTNYFIIQLGQIIESPVKERSMAHNL